ncbi:hypothetical protein EDF75_0792 [Raoultella sp. BIGb0149]|uniref:hypothetical protein n=1 Tax=Raoultella sp. BIGb0149 TaxID=2485116 RepID=UPI00105E529C|nr:hypothetical protein [Raoultella sp. BIGb0149]TDQ26741.1 hypothetical protein EDF75_0792 [Raoultella sp. BIGb0149]
MSSVNDLDLEDNIEQLDVRMNSEELSTKGRLGKDFDTWAGIQERNRLAIEDARKNISLLGLPFTTAPEAQAAADAGEIPVGAITWVRNTGDASLADEYINNAGTIEATGRRMPSQQAVDSVQEQVSDIRDDVSTVRGGMGNYTGESLCPLAADASDNMVMWYDPVTDEIQGNGLVTESNIGKTVQAVPGVRVYKGSSLTPIVTDSQNKIMLGYDSDSDEIHGVGLVSNSTMNDDYAAKKFTGETSTVYPVLTDSKNKVLLGYDAGADRVIAAGLDFTGTVPVYIDEPLPFNPLARLINQMLVYGQSLAAGRDGIPLLSTTQPFSNLTYIGGTRGGGLNAQDFSASKPLVEDSINPSPDGGTSRGETVCSGAANYASLAAYVENGVDPASHIIFASSAGKSGAPIGDLKKGTAWYNAQFMAHVTGVHAFNSDVAVQVIMWLQGESNSDGRIPDGTKAAYKATLRQLRIDAEADIKAVTGQTTPVPMIVYQHSTNIRTNTNTALAFYDLITEKNSMFFFATPLYMFPHAADGLHMTAVGYKWAACYYGRAYKQMMHDRIRPRYIRPISAVYVGGVVRVKFNVPKAPLVLDTKNLKATQDYGFSVYSGGSKVTINAVSIENDDTVVIETGAASLSSVVVKYGIDYLGAGLNIQMGASGNLRDSEPETQFIDGKDRPLFYLCPHLEINAINGAI